MSLRREQRITGRILGHSFVTVRGISEEVDEILIKMTFGGAKYEIFPVERVKQEQAYFKNGEKYRLDHSQNAQTQ